MYGENTTAAETLFTADAIAFYVWVLGVAITGIWKKGDAGDWIKLSFMLLGYVIFAMVIAIIVMYWFGSNGMIALAVIFLSYRITKAYIDFKKWWRRINMNDVVMKSEQHEYNVKSLLLQKGCNEMADKRKKRTKCLKFGGYIFMPDAKDDYDGLREYSTNLGQGTLTVMLQSELDIS